MRRFNFGALFLTLLFVCLKISDSEHSTLLTRLIRSIDQSPYEDWNIPRSLPPPWRRPWNWTFERPSWNHHHHFMPEFGEGGFKLKPWKCGCSHGRGKNKTDGFTPNGTNSNNGTFPWGPEIPDMDNGGRSDVLPYPEPA